MGKTLSLYYTLALFAVGASLTRGVPLMRRQTRDTVECTFDISTQDILNAWEVDLASQFNQAVIFPVLDTVPSGSAWNRGAIITSSDFDNKKWVFENVVSAVGWTALETKSFLESLEGMEVKTLFPPFTWHYDAITCAIAEPA